MHNILIKLFTLLMTFALVGCGASLPTITPYKMDVQQGNVVTSEMLLKLRPGMSKSQVQYILGTPLLVDSFHSDRWDYFYQLRKQGKIVNQHRVILDFDGDSLARVRGDVIPKGTDVTTLVQSKEKAEANAEDAGDSEIVVKTIETPEIESAAVEEMAPEADAVEQTTDVVANVEEPMKDALLDPVPEVAGEEIEPLPEVVDATADVAEEAAKVEAAKLEAAKVEAAKVEAAKVEAAKVEAAKVEAAKVEAAKVEAAKVEAAKVEAAKLEAAKVEAAKLEAAKLEAAKLEAAKLEAAKLEAAKRRPTRKTKVPMPPVMGPVAKKVKPEPAPVIETEPVVEPKVEQPKPEVTLPEPVVEPPKVEMPALDDASVAEQVEQVVEEIETQVVEPEQTPVKVKPVSELPTSIRTSISAKDRAKLRMERKLDASRVGTAVPTVDTLPEVKPTEGSEMPSDIQTKSDSPTNQEEPGFFERALEKIGF